MFYKPIIIFILLSYFLDATVEHKEEFIDVYLSNISQNMDEKTELLEHIQRSPDGNFLDIGTGGDSIAIIAKKLPKNSRPTLIAADIDPLVISSIKKRQPEIEPFINSKTGPKVEFLTTSATNMTVIPDNSLSGISASALAHEVFSYTPAQGALDQFIGEVCRTLEKNGVFVYRDPKWVNDPDLRCIATIKSEAGKYYASLFLTKFLDRKFSLIRDYRNQCCKPQMYSPKDIKITAYLKNTNRSVQLDFETFQKTPSSQIDYSKNFSIEAPKGLIAELQRHYLMYLKNYFPVYLLTSKQSEDGLNIESFTTEEQTVFGIIKDKNKVDTINNQPALFNQLNVLRKIFNQAYTFSATNNLDVLTYANVLLKDGIDRNLLHLTDDRVLEIDPKTLTLLFGGKNQGLFRYLPPEDLPLDLLEHLKLEGEEHYFYKTTDQLITYIGQYSRFLLKDTSKSGYCLAPINYDYVKETTRNLYQGVLERDMMVIDQHGIIQPPVTEKNIIHFQLQPQRDSFNVYKTLISKDPEKFPELKKWVTMGDYEILDLVSEQDEVIGAISKTDIYAKRMNNFRVINAFVINSEGQVWIPTRHPSKTLFPLSLDCSVGGHVLTDESYYDAFLRETEEEINLNVRKLPHKKLGKLTPQNNHTSAFMEVYAIYYDGPIPYNQDDFIDGKWTSPKELKQMLKNGHAAKNDLKIIVEEFL